MRYYKIQMGYVLNLGTILKSPLKFRNQKWNICKATKIESNVITEKIWFGLFSLFNGISTFVSYQMPKPSL